jgi:NADPH:quinone reductase-like Zn-dependent oxidoreductase
MPNYVVKRNLGGIPACTCGRLYSNSVEVGEQLPLKVIKPGGLLIAFGFSNAVRMGKTSVILDFIRFKIRGLLPSSRRMTFYSITALRRKHPDWFAHDLSKLFELLSRSKIKPSIWKRMPLSEARKAHELIEQSKPIGKIILEV